VSYESSAEPIKIGYLMDFLLPEGFPKRYFKDVPQPSDLVFKNAAEQGLIGLACRRADLLVRPAGQWQTYGGRRAHGAGRVGSGVGAPGRCRRLLTRSRRSRSPGRRPADSSPSRDARTV
jgi:hypothetical protein